MCKQGDWKVQAVRAVSATALAAARGERRMRTMGQVYNLTCGHVFLQPRKRHHIHPRRITLVMRPSIVKICLDCCVQPYMQWLEKYWLMLNAVAVPSCLAT